MKRFENIGIIKNELNYDADKLIYFEKAISNLKVNRIWSKEELKELFFNLIPDFGHKETGKYLDSKM